METSGPKAAATARSCGISATHGTHHVAQMLTRRTFALRGNTSLIFAGSLTSRSSAAEREVARRMMNAVRFTEGAIFHPMEVIAIGGPSGSGKTTRLVELIRTALANGRSAGAIKHTHHPLNEENRGDTARFLAAGA